MSIQTYAWTAILAIFLGATLVQAETVDDESTISITNVSFVAPSPEKENLNDEWVEISNLGDMDEDLTGWTLEDEQNHTYMFQGFILKAGASVKIHTGVGNDTSSDLYWNKNTSIWNNNGDVATLKDASENVIFSYPKEFFFSIHMSANLKCDLSPKHLWCYLDES